MAERLSAQAARRIALSAQGFTDRRPTGVIDRRHGRRVVDRVGLIQVDSVNVLARSQELPMFARLGPHRRDLIPMMIASNELFEYWGHEASLLPVAHQPLLRWRMAQATNGEAGWGGLLKLARERPGYLEAVFDEVRDRGPITAGELSDPGSKNGPWWGRSYGKNALEYLFWCGRITGRRRGNFEREYDLPERVLPAAILNVPTPSMHDAQRQLLMIAARAHGVATASELADYHRLRTVRPLIESLVEDGLLLKLEVDGWNQPGYLHPSASMPRQVSARALLSPFDSLVWERTRTEQLFGMRYRIEIYVPEPKRVHGYYVLPFLLGEELVARVDLKSDRKQGTLVVQAAWGEPGIHEAEVASELAEELDLMATWLGLERVHVTGRGDLATALSRAIAALQQ